MRGFTLLEVVVAFAIAAMVLAMLTEAVGAGLRSSRVATQTEGALARARSLLAGVLDPRPGEQSGVDGSYGWRLLIRPAAVGRERDAPGQSQGAGPRPVLMDVTADVSWGADEARRHVVLSTLRLGRAS